MNKLMNRLYSKNQITFAIVMIVIYVVGSSLAESISDSLGVTKLITVIFHLVFTAVILRWIKKNGIMKEYGLVLPQYNLKAAGFFVPLILVAGADLIVGIKMNFSVFETVLYVVSMLCVGFLEEIIFRGFLFVGMAKNNVRSAIIVSSITFGIGHIVNLLNGYPAVETMLQIVFAILTGFTLVLLFYRGKSLLPCIIFHSVNNALSAFEFSYAEAAQKLSASEIKFEVMLVSVLGCILTAYCVFLSRKLSSAVPQ